MRSPTRVVLLRDGNWRQVPGVCCWRHGVASAFAAAGAEVVEATCPPAAVSASGGARPARPPAAGSLVTGSPVARSPVAWLPAPVRRPVARAYRSSRRVAGGVASWRRRVAADRHRRAERTEVAPLLDSAALVVAESLPAAALAADCGVPRRRLWALALPAERLFAGDRTGLAGALAEVAAAVGGFLTDGEPARESVERATSQVPARVELFPPVAADRTCPSCGDAAADPAPEAAPEAAPEEARLARLRAELARPRAESDRSTEPGRSAQAQVDTAAAVLETVLAQPSHPTRTARSVLVAGYDLRFAGDLAERLDRRRDLDVTVDDWPRLGQPTPHTAERLRRADAVLAEWARTSAVWLSRHKRPGQFLAVRLHRYELDFPYPREIAIENVDAVVYIAPLFGRRIRDELGWPADKLVYIPNYLDLGRFDRPKPPQARFCLGLVGIEWSRKRFDLALDLLAALRREDLRFTLVVRSSMPWQNPYAWADPAERAYAGRCFERLEADPLLRGGVRFDPTGRDMARWYRGIGHIVSTSDAEGSHASVAEAMASGAIPVVRAWPGAAEVYDGEWVHTGTDEAVAAVLDGVEADRWARRGARAKAEIRRTHDPAAVVDAWADLLHGDLAAARGRQAASLVGAR